MIHQSAVPLPLTRPWQRVFLSAFLGCMVLVLLGITVAPVQGANGDEIFLKHCALCHGKDGKAQNPAARKLGVKNLSESKATDAEIVKQVTEGKKDDRGNLKMPAFRDKLAAEEIQSLVVVVKRFRR